MGNPVQEAKHLAIGCLYLLARRAIPDFPGTTRAAPSEWVVVSLATGKPLRDGDQVYFPFKIQWNIWQWVIIPILTVTDPGRAPYVIGSGSVPNQLTGKCYDLGVEIQTTLRDNLRLQGNVASIGYGDYDSLIGKLTVAIGMLLEDQGYVPTGRITKG